MTAVLTETSGGWCESCCHVSDSLLAAALQDGKFSQLNISKGPVKKKNQRPAVQDKQIYLAPPAAPVLRVRGDSGSVGPAIGAGSELEPTEA